MYNAEIIQSLAAFIAENDGINDKEKLAQKVMARFNLTNKRSVFYCSDFAIRFCSSQAEGSSFANTVLSLSTLRKHDDIPFLVCLVTPHKNYLMMANTTFLSKISHSSQKLSIDKIRGSFNGSDIIRSIDDIDNEPGNFEDLFTLHESCSPAENLERLVEATNNISPSGRRFEPDDAQTDCIMRSIDRAKAFMNSEAYTVLNSDLQERVQAVAAEIIIASSSIANVNLRGRVIEYLIASPANDPIRFELIGALHKGKPIPEIYTADELGDYEREVMGYSTAVDIKSKLLCASSSPKGYNIDKVLSFLSCEDSVYLVYIIGVIGQRIFTRLCSMYNSQLLHNIRRTYIWAGRNSRGTTQYDGKALEDILYNFDGSIDVEEAANFLVRCMNA